MHWLAYVPLAFGAAWGWAALAAPVVMAALLMKLSGVPILEEDMAKRKPGYANFAIAEPPLKLILFENAVAPHGSVNHLGVEVESTDEVGATQRRLANEGLATATEDEVACCYAVQDKVWVDAPDGEPWEIYTVLSDVEMAPGELRTVEPGADAVCCATAPESAARCC